MIQDDAVVASYGQQLSRGGMDVGVNLGRVSDLRLGAYVGRLKANVDVGDPGPARSQRQGGRHRAELALSTRRTVRSCPSRGSLAFANLQYVFDGPDITPPLPSGRSSVELMQLSGEANHFWPAGERGRLFALGGGGTSFGKQPAADRSVRARLDRSISARTTTANSAAITTTS